MGVITANRGSLRGGIISNICQTSPGEIRSQIYPDYIGTPISGVFIANNVCGQIEGNILTGYGKITNNIVEQIKHNITSIISDNNCRAILANTVDKGIFDNYLSNSIFLNIIKGEGISENNLGIITGNIADSITLNVLSSISVIAGNLIKGKIGDNTLDGDIIGNHSGDIINNY